MPVMRLSGSAKLKKLQARTQREEDLEKERVGKARTKAWIEGGKLMDRYGLLSWDEDELDAYLERGLEIDAKTRSALKKEGMALRARRDEESAKLREVIVITYPAPVPGIGVGALRKAGFKLNKLRGCWEGNVDPAEAADLARAYDGKMERIGTAEAEMPLAAE